MSAAVKERPVRATQAKRGLGKERQKLFARLQEINAAKLREIQSVYNELKQLMKPEEIGPWLLTEMEEFEGRTPADLISKGETGRLWASLFYLRSGMPD